jgi:hypothetical protein
MSRSIRFCLSVLLGFLLVTLLILVCPRHAIAAPAPNHFGRTSAPATFFGGYAAPFFPSYGDSSGIYPSMPKDWWTGAYPKWTPGRRDTIRMQEVLAIQLKPLPQQTTSQVHQ